MTGKNVFHPVGWNAFGATAENAALEKGVDPEIWTQKNIANAKKSMEEFSFSFDWNREFATCDSDYYKWTQFLFLKLYENGMVYRKKAIVDRDPEGRSAVEKKVLNQWFIRTTKIAKNLYDGLSDPELKSWEDVIEIHKNWIGECNGTTIDFEIVGDNSKIKLDAMPIWMRNPEYIDRAKFVAVVPRSDWDVGADSDGLLPYLVANPITGDVLPVYVTHLVEYPDKCDRRLGIPDFNESDKSFAESVCIATSTDVGASMTPADFLEFREKICAEARVRGIGGFATGPTTKDWSVSRRRYWGTPIPIVYCNDCKGPLPVNENDLPVRLPRIRKIEKGKNHLAEDSEWFKTTCPKCGGEAERETDTMDSFLDSSWCYLRFLDPDNAGAPFDVEKINKFMPVDLYVGEKEQAVLHLYYSRFFNYILHSAGLVRCKEPFKNLLPLGALKARTYFSAESGNYVAKNLVEIKNGAAFHKETEEPLIETWEKMSESKSNGIEPRAMIEKYGIDTTRLILLSAGNPKSDLLWQEEAFTEIFVWQETLWHLIADFNLLRSRNSPKPDRESDQFKKEETFLAINRNRYLKTINACMQDNGDVADAISCMQALCKKVTECSEETIRFGFQYEKTLSIVIILLAPMAPSFASELWAGFVKAPNRICDPKQICWDLPLHRQSWPSIDEDLNLDSNLTQLEVKIKKFDRRKDKGETSEGDHLKRDSVS